MKKFFAKYFKGVPAEKRGYCIYYLQSEGFYVVYGSQTEVFKKLNLKVIGAQDIITHLEEDFRLDKVIDKAKEVEEFLQRAMMNIDLEKPMFARRKPIRVDRFLNKWELRVLHLKNANGIWEKHFFPFGKAKPVVEKVEYETFNDPKQVRTFTYPYIPIFFLKQLP